jgi:DNA helicase II / ATP-dependent DNA helicase PcrA
MGTQTSTDIFDKRYKELNSKQKEAVDTIEGPVMVIAGPGTGKTTILTLRIANILKTTDTPASSILAITFTEQGARNMRAKLREVIGAQANEVRVHTFHGFASSVISEFQDHFTHLHNFKPVSDVESEALVRKIIEVPEFTSIRPIGAPDFYLGSILSTISDAKREALSPLMIADFAKSEIQEIQNDETNISTRGASKGELKAEAKKRIEKLEKTILFSKVYGLYEENKREKKVMDYDDIIFELLLTLGRDELLLRQVQEKFLYLLIDEHQDTNDAQNLIIKMIADFFETPNIFIVGDEKQAIFRFQGASVENFLKFEKTWNNMKIISLENNYRSHQHILDASFSMIENNYGEGEHVKLRTPLVSGVKHAIKPIGLISAASISDAEVYLFNELKKIALTDKTVAVVVKKNKEVDRLVALGERMGVPVSAERSVDIFSHPVGMLFFSLMDVLYDPLNTEALGKTLVAGLWGFDFTQTVEALKELKKGNVERVVSRIPMIKKLREEKLTDSPISLIISLANYSGLTKIIANDPLYVEVYRGVIELAQKLMKQRNINDFETLFNILSDYRLSSEKKFIKMTVGVTEGNIKVMTAHGSKGLEFDYVFIPYATEESWLSGRKGSFFALPFAGKKNENDEVRDARRLFYVALTRAKEHLVLIAPSEDGAGEIMEPLRFLSEINSDFITNVSAPETDKSIILENIFTSSENKIVEYAKQVILEKGLSVTALNHFVSCPQAFLFKSILKLPEAPSMSSEKGNAMHLACDYIWREPKDLRTKENIHEVIVKAIHEHMTDSLLSEADKKAVIQELEKNAPAVANSLHAHFNTQGEVSSESWVEYEHVSSYKGINISVRLHGKLDAIVQQQDTVLVFDYKTKKKMSENEIRGNTQNSDGGYFRQLVFYKMLLANELKSKGKEIIPSLVFLTPDDKGICHSQSLQILDSDIEAVKNNIDELVNSVWSGKVNDTYCDEEKCEWCAFAKVIKNL